MSQPINSVQANLIEQDSIIEIDNAEYTPSGRNVGGSIYIDAECIDWLVDSLESHLAGTPTLIQSFPHGTIDVSFAGPDYQPLVAIFSRRNDNAPHGGKGVATMSAALAQQLVDQLKDLQNQIQSGVTTQLKITPPSSKEVVSSAQTANEKFAVLKDLRETQREEELSKAKAQAAGTSKEAFSPLRYIQLYLEISEKDEDDFDDWDAIVAEAEYDYYVRYANQMTLKDFVDYEFKMEGWG